MIFRGEDKISHGWVDLEGGGEEIERRRRQSTRRQ